MGQKECTPGDRAGVIPGFRPHGPVSRHRSEETIGVADAYSGCSYALALPVQLKISC